MADLLERDVATGGPYAYAEPTWQEELAASGDIPLFDHMNLREHETGVPGHIFLSTAVAQHGPRVKYYVKAANDQPSFSVSIAPNARVVASSLDDRITRSRGRQVIAWVELNRTALLDFWNEGAFWTEDERLEFKRTLVSMSE